MRREAMNNSSSLALQCSAVGRASWAGRSRCKMPPEPEEGGVSRVNAKGQTDERPPYSGQILWTLSGPFSWSSLATMLAAGGLQAGRRRYATRPCKTSARITTTACSMQLTR